MMLCQNCVSIIVNDMHNLIICPVGSPISFYPKFNKDNHWRYTKSNRLYETLVFQYSDFVPEDGTYDYLIKQKGFKWNLSKEWLSKNDYSKYEYIGFMDDDLITDVENVNRALTIAKQNNHKIFQLSVTKDSDEFFPILRNDPNLKYAVTNFVETMGMFIHTSLIPIVQEFWNMYEIYTGWGFDLVLCDITQTDASVIHASQMYHPKKDSSYDKTNAFREMDLVLNYIAPNFMKTKYNKQWFYKESQVNLNLVFDL